MTTMKHALTMVGVEDAEKNNKMINYIKNILVQFSGHQVQISKRKKPKAAGTASGKDSDDEGEHSDSSTGFITFTVHLFYGLLLKFIIRSIRISLLVFLHLESTMP